jgi:hypothetical protein
MLLFLATACHQKKSSGQSDLTSSDPALKQDDSVQNKFLPVADYLRSEIMYVDSTPLAVLKYNIVDNKTDSSFIQPAEFNQLSQEFLVPELAPGVFEKNYIETSFQDETTGYLTFTYSPGDKDLPLSRVDVLTSPDKGANKVRSIFLQRVSRSGDSLVTKKMYWNAGHSYLIITSVQLPQKAPISRQIKVVWNPE